MGRGRTVDSGISKDVALRILTAAGCEKALALAESGNNTSYEFYEEKTIRDIVGKLLYYGSVSDKTMVFLKALIERVEKRPEIEAARAAEAAAAKPVPVTKERITVRGEILTVKERTSRFGIVMKMLVKTEDGWKCWGTRPSMSSPDVAVAWAEKGDMVEFVARIEPSKDDPKFGFFSRPTKGVVLKKANEAKVAA